MATAAQTEHPTPGSTVYDAFISYSHAADDLLAPRLQAGLQKFAKPWSKRRAVRIFRDESSLSANPHLWSSITEALDTSGWFVLLLSPDAAASEWVSQEITYWVEHRDPNRILPVVTDGSFGWADGDVIGDAVPEALRGVFGEEARWVDVRWAKDEDQLDLKDPRFADAIADIASTIRGVPKDDLASEEVRQHRRTVRTAWAGVSMIGVLAVASVGFGMNAANERDRANSEADRANTLAEQEASARNDADANAAQAAANADEAEIQAAVARARELAASSISVRSSDPGLATLLAIEAIQVAGDVEDAIFAEGLISLREATYSNLLLARRSHSGGGKVDIAYTLDGSGLLVTSESDRSVSLFDVNNLDGAPVWTYQDLTTNDIIVRAVPGPDGSEIAVIVADGPFLGEPGSDVDFIAPGDDGFPGRIVLLDSATGSQVDVVEIGGCVEPTVLDWGGPNPSDYSPRGSVFSLVVRTTECAEGAERPTGAKLGFQDMVIFDKASWTEVRRLSDLDGLEHGGISFTADETLALVTFDYEQTELRSFPDFELLEIFEFETLSSPPAVTGISPDGAAFFLSMAIAGDPRPGFWSVDEGAFLGWGDRYEGLSLDGTFTPEGEVLAIGTDSSTIYDAATGLARLTMPTAGVQAFDVDPGGTSVATVSLGGDVELWALQPDTGLVRPFGEHVGWINPNEIIEGPHVAIRAYGRPYAVHVIDPKTGVIEHELPTWSADVLPDGRFVMSVLDRRPAPTENDPEAMAAWEGPLVVRDPAGQEIEVLQECTGFIGDLLDRSEVPVCPDGSPLFTSTVRVSSDGTRIAAMAVGGEIRLWDVETLMPIRTVSSRPGDGLLEHGDGWVLTGAHVGGMIENSKKHIVVDTETGDALAEMEGNWRLDTTALSQDGSRLFIMDVGGQAFEYDTTTWELVRAWQAQPGKSRGIALSPDDTMLAVSGEDGLIVVWQIDDADPVRLQGVPTIADRVSDIVWIDSDRLGAVIVADGRTMWQVIDLPTAVVVEKALKGLVRGFTDVECKTYRIEGCPTLEEMRSR